jgi:hypothetical protein
LPKFDRTHEKGTKVVVEIGDEMNLDALLEPMESKPFVCKLRAIIEALEDPYRSALLDLVESSPERGGLSANQLSAKVKKAGLSISSASIHRHRAKICPCERN